MMADFPVSNTGLGAAIARIIETAEALGLDPRTGQRMSVVLDETIANLLRHDDSLRPDARFTLALSAETGALRMVLRDPGRPFDPLSHVQDETPEIGGQGINLIRSLSSDLHYRRDGAWNELSVLVDASPLGT